MAAIKLSKIVNISTAIVRREATLTYTMQSLRSYGQAFEEHYAVRFIDVNIMDVVEDTLPSKILAGICRAIYIRYIRVGKKLIKHQGVSFLLLKPGKDTLAAKTLGITQRDDQSLYNSSEIDILYMFQATDAIVKNGRKPSLFPRKFLLLTCHTPFR